MDMQAFYRNMDEVLDVKPGTVKGRDLLDSLDLWDSVAVVWFIGMADEKYGATIPPKRVAECKNIDDLAALIRESRSDASDANGSVRASNSGKLGGELPNAAKTVGLA